MVLGKDIKGFQIDLPMCYDHVLCVPVTSGEETEVTQPMRRLGQESPPPSCLTLRKLEGATH